MLSLLDYHTVNLHMSWGGGGVRMTKTKQIEAKHKESRELEGLRKTCGVSFRTRLLYK